MTKYTALAIGILLYCGVSTWDYYEAVIFEDWLKDQQQCRHEIETHNSNKVTCHNLAMDGNLVMERKYGKP